LNDTVRKHICPDKITGSQWIEIHEEAHLEGLKTNATMLFGHLETIRHRIEHMALLRDLQDKTGGFQAFIPLKFRNSNNQLSNLQESGIQEDLKLFAISRLFLDNITHIKIYWPAFGKNFASLALSFGADDLDGTILNSTKIYSMAGAEDQHPEMTIEEAVHLVSSSGYQPVLRDSIYNILKRY
jgi:aminodeoxyfutalosine synthase